MSAWRPWRRAVADRAAPEIEDRVFAAGGVAAALRTPEGWHAHPQGQAVAAEPLIGHRVLGPAPPRRRDRAPLPMAGIRVLDLTRVIAGPVCTRYLGALGADVLRIDPRPAGCQAWCGGRHAPRQAQRLRGSGHPGGQSTVHHLLDEADVVVHGYRPGALDRFGLESRGLSARHPGLVIVHLDAWGHSGPWSARRGFDSIVQAACGIATIEAPDDSSPGALPASCSTTGPATWPRPPSSTVCGGRAWKGARSSGPSRWLGRRLAHRGLGPAHGATGRARRSAGWDLEASRRRPTGRSSSTARRDRSSPSPLPGRLNGRPLEWADPAAGYGRDRPAWTEG